MGVLSAVSFLLVTACASTSGESVGSAQQIGSSSSGSTTTNISTPAGPGGLCIIVGTTPCRATPYVTITVNFKADTTSNAIDGASQTLLADMAEARPPIIDAQITPVYNKNQLLVTWSNSNPSDKTVTEVVGFASVSNLVIGTSVSR